MTNYRIYILALFTFGFFNIAQAQESISFLMDPQSSPREKVVDMQKILIELEFDLQAKKVMGKVQEDFKVLRKEVDSLYLDAIEMEFSSILLNGKEVEFKNKGKGVEIYFTPALKWKEEHRISIEYSTWPKKGLYFIGWDDTTGMGRKQIWTQGQGIDNRHWLPMYDEMNDKLISEMIVHFDGQYKVLSNGEKLREKKGKNGKKIWHYRISKPHAPYLIMLGIGDYAIEKRKSESGVEQNLYYYPDEPQTVDPTYRYSVRMFDFFEKEFGDYPWKSYSQIPVQNFMYGAMENTTATIFGDFYLVDERSYLDRNYVRVNAHELVHQWFGDMITARSSTHTWLQEGFATHYDLVYQGEAFGKDYFDWVRRTYNNLAVAETEKNYMGIAHSAAGYVRHYPKSALVLQMLKDVVGDEQFKAVIKYYLQKHAYSNVDSEDLLIAFHEKLGLSLDWFWNQWVYKGGEPSYKVELEESSEYIDFNVKQVHERNELLGLFRMPIVFELHFSDGTEFSKEVWVGNEHHSIRFEKPKDKELSYALFDPNSRILKSVEFNKSPSMLKNQAANAEHMLDRYDAIQALNTQDILGLKDFYLQQFKKEEFFAIKNEILNQLMLPTISEYPEIVQMAINDKDVEVRKAVLDNSLIIPANLESEYVKLLKDSSYQIIEKTLELLSFDFPENRQKYLEITKNQKGNRGHNVRIKYLEIAYFESGDEKYINELIGYLSASHEFSTQINAAAALENLNYLNDKAIEYLLDARLSFNYRLNSAMKNTLDHFYAQHKYKKMIHTYVTAREWDVKEYSRIHEYMQR